jgi:DNA-binding response OmpR family regulator/anti-sigma regulatory factor (Ser/Thr protein kinase)
VLAVDDEEEFLELEQLYLGRSDMAVTLCGSARSALDELARGDYDMIVSDYQMPDINGVEFLKMVRKSGSDVGFILFTGKGREDVAIDALNAGANYYIQKGADLQSQFALLVGIVEEVQRARVSSKALAESERLLRISNRRLDLLGSITRHDTLGGVIAAEAFVELARSEADPVKAQTYLSKAKTSLEKARVIIEVARTYQINGAMDIKWDSLRSVLDRSSKSVHMNGVTYSNTTNDWQILVDPLLEMVCANIITNSVRHGRNVTKIVARSELVDDGLDLIIEDDGCGIAEEDKERIFGLLTPAGAPHGLAIARRILEAEMIQIREAGTCGSGARFVLHFPDGLFKRTSSMRVGGQQG